MDPRSNTLDPEPEKGLMRRVIGIGPGKEAISLAVRTLWGAPAKTFLTQPMVSPSHPRAWIWSLIIPGHTGPKSEKILAIHKCKPVGLAPRK
jgi:hypothetical protein